MRRSCQFNLLCAVSVSADAKFFTVGSMYCCCERECHVVYDYSILPCRERVLTYQNPDTHIHFIVAFICMWFYTVVLPIYEKIISLQNVLLLEKQDRMKEEYIPFVEELIELAIREDIGDGDHTSLATIPTDARGRMKLLVKEKGIIAGIEVASMVLRRLDADMRFDQRIEDGTCVEPGDVAFYVEGRILSMLQAERIVLNIMQRMSGVATQTAEYVRRLEGTPCHVLDTRKTTPGMRVLEKMAVKLGGGENHRIGLFDMVLLKDNHIDFAGGITEALGATRRYLAEKGKSLPIEIEVRSLEDIDKVFAAGGADRIMLDNFSVEMTVEAVKKIAGRCEIESSGGITLDTLRDYAECGVDFVSVGALTHQIRSLDMSLKACK